MSRTIYLSIFLVIITLTLTAASLFVLNRLEVYFGLNLYFLAILPLLFPIGLILDKINSNKITTKLYAYNWILAGSILISWTVFLGIELFSLLFNFSNQVKGILAIIITAITLTSSFISAENIILKKITIPTNTKKPIKIIQVSDIHLGTIHGKKFLDRVVKKINKTNPDYVFIIGDLFDGSGLVTKKTLSPLKKLTRKPYFVMGNHDFYSGQDNVSKKLEGLAIILRNQVVETKDLQIIGLDNPKTEKVKHLKIFEELGNKIHNKKPSIALLHTPTAIESFKKTKCDIMLSGHTHAG